MARTLCSKASKLLKDLALLLDTSSLSVLSNVAVTLDLTSLLKMASSSKGKASRNPIHLLDEELLRGYQNTRVQILPANDPENQLHIPLQIFCNNNKKELNNNAIIVCEYEGIWHQVLFLGEKVTLRQPKEFIHQYDVPDQSTKELAVLLDHQTRISPATSGKDPFA